MGYVFSYPGVMEHARQIALALDEAQALKVFVTSYVFREPSATAALVGLLPGPRRAAVLRQLRRRAIPDFPAGKIRSEPGPEIVRTLADKLKLGAVAVDRIWDAGAQAFDRKVARHDLPGSSGVIGFEYSSLSSFQRAGELGLARILHLPALDNRAMRAIQQEQKARWPGTRSPNDDYFDGLFEIRQARRRAEIDLADLIITNSELTRRSHIAGGADPAKVIAVPLAAPPPITAVTRGSGGCGPLRVLWSGGFTLGKGALQLLEAWTALDLGGAAQLDIYGHVGLPSDLLNGLPANITLHGSIPRAELMDHYAQADLLVFPSLADGFGMAVTEALSRGVPVLVSDQAGAAELIEPWRNGLVIPAADSVALAEGLTWCLENRNALQAMRAAALESARRRQWRDYRRDHMLALAAAPRPDEHRHPAEPDQVSA